MTELTVARVGAPAAGYDLPGETVAARARPISSNARFFTRGGAIAVRGCMAALNRVSPPLAARVGYRFLSVPPRFRQKPEEHAVRARAQEWRIAFGRRWLHCYGWGRGPVILLAHGWGGRGTQFGPWIEPLVKAGFRCVAFDHPAHGRSTGGDTDMIEMARAIAAVSETCGPVHAVVGHSLGAATSLLAMRDFQLKCETFVSISCLAHFMWIVDVAGDFLKLKPELRRRMRNLLVKRHQGRVTWESLSTADILRSAPMDVLLIHDRDDREVPIAHALQLNEAAGGAKLLATDNLGHRRILKDQQVIAAAVAFVSAQRPAGATRPAATPTSALAALA
jgi:pimeloyl-ACP methyl ester carboxylesterase